MRDSLYAFLTGFRGLGGRECARARESPAGAFLDPLTGVLGSPVGLYCVFRPSGRACFVASSGDCPHLCAGYCAGGGGGGVDAASRVARRLLFSQSGGSERLRPSHTANSSPLSVPGLRMCSGGFTPGVLWG